ncbi:MAG: DNA adenine methylase [Desulfobacterales bacterium]|nr:DNA adenine methylase [Desulfobacterales bacterium]
MDSPFAYIGGKSKLSNQIIERFPDHKSYIEVFGGALWVFFRKPVSKYEVVNDFDGELIAFYRVIQNHLEEFLKQFKFMLSSREFFNDWKDQLDTRGLTDIQKAARYYFCQRQCFGGRVRNRTFGVVPESLPRINLIRMEEELSEVHLRLSRVVIENLDYVDLINRYDKPDSLFFLDPPYYKAPTYKHNFHSLDDYEKINENLKNIKGKFLLSINDHEAIREIYKEFNIETLNLKYTVAKDNQKDVTELLISNFKIEKQQLELF